MTREEIEYHEEQRRRAANDAVARVRDQALLKLDNIRLFADREQPNREGILRMVAEIELLFGRKNLD